jgi:NitT/TauT family transport system substrate-binding protein
LARLLTLSAIVSMLTAACQAERQPPMRIGTLLWPGTELLHFAQHDGHLPPDDFRLVEFVDDGELMRAFRNGTVEAAMLTLDEVLSLAGGGADPVILLVADESRGGDAIMAQPGITGVSELKGRRVAAQVQSGGAYLLAQALTQAGLRATDLQIVNLPPYRQTEAFAAGSIDAVATHDPFRLLASATGASDIFNSNMAGDRPLRVLAFRRESLDGAAARAEVLCQAWYAAVDATQRLASAREWIATRTRTSPGDFEQMLGRLRLMNREDNRRYLSGPTPALLTAAARTRAMMHAAGLAVGETPLRQLLERPTALGGGCPPE